MKLLLENWQHFLEEEKFSLLVEQELNEATIEDFKKWFSDKFKRGASKEDLEKEIDKVPDESKRRLLQGLLAAAAVAAVGGIPAIAKGTPTEPTPEMIRLFNSWRKKAIGDYFPGRDAANRIIKLLVKKAHATGSTNTTFKSISDIYPKVYDQFIQQLNKMKVEVQSLAQDKFAFIRTAKYKDNRLEPYSIVFNSNVDWESDSGFARQTGYVTRDAGLSHELEHAVEAAFSGATKGVLTLSEDAFEELKAIFDIESLQHGDWQPGEALSSEKWARSIEEIYADFKGLRTRLGGRVEKQHLDNLCQQRCEPTAPRVPRVNFLNKAILAKLKCTPECLFDNSEDGIEAANSFAMTTQDKLDDGAIV